MAKKAVSAKDKLPYHSLKDFQRAVRSEIHKLHDATEHFVRLAVHKAVDNKKILDVEKHVLEIGKNIDELEEILYKISLRKH